MINTKDIQSFICKHWLTKYFCPYVCSNFEGGGIGWEMDVMAINKTLSITEFEIKVSRGDFFADFKKETKHQFLQKAVAGELSFLTSVIPNYFYYCCPKGLIKEEEIPSYAGLIYFTKFSLSDKPGVSYIEYETIKKAPKLHRDKAPEKVIHKLARVLSARLILGCALLSYQNNQKREKRKEYEQKNQEALGSLQSFQQAIKKAGLRK